MSYHWSDYDLAELGFDEKRVNMSESSVDSWNRVSFVNKEGDKIFVNSELWYEAASPIWFRLYIEGEKYSFYVMNKNELGKIIQGLKKNKE
jgi:hypothetical protein